MPTFVTHGDPNVIEPGSPRARYDEANRKAPSPTVYDNPATQSARATGSALAQQGQGVAATQQNTAQGFANQASGFNPQAQSITAAGGMAPANTNAAPAGGLAGLQAQNAAGLGPMGRSTGSAISPSFAAARGQMNVSQPGAPKSPFLGASAPGSAFAPAGGVPGAPAAARSGPPAPPAFGVGQQVAATNYGSVANVDPGALGAYGNAAGQLGGAPGTVAGQLGAAPQVGNVGNIATGAAPGAVAGQLGTMGASSADQQSMMARLNGFLDAPDGPSVAEAQLQQAQANNIGQMLGLARSGRGGAGAQAQALAGAMSEGSALASDTAGQMATLRAQEEDMRRNRALSAIGLGGEMATAARGQDLGYRGQDLAALQGDQATSLGARGQDLQASMANQSTQSQLEQLRAQTALGARGQDLSALQGDQSTALGARGQDLSALQSDIQAQIAARGQNLSALQGNQSAGVSTRGQDIAAQSDLNNVNTTRRAQDLAALTSDADRNLAAQQLALQGKLGFGGLQNQATGQGLDYLSNANQQALGAEGMAQANIMQGQRNLLDLQLGNQANDTSIKNTNTAAAAQAAAQPSFLQSLLPVGGTIAGAILGGPIGAAIGGGIGAGVQSQIRPIDRQNPYG